jgi:hypothetical protein
MEVFIRNATEVYHQDLKIKLEVFNVVNDIVDDVEECASVNSMKRAEKNLMVSEKIVESMVQKIREVQAKNVRLDEQVVTMKKLASKTRETFVKDIGFFLAENKQVTKLKDRIATLELRLSRLAEYESDESLNNEQKGDKDKARPECVANNEESASVSDDKLSSSRTSEVDLTAPLSSVALVPVAADNSSSVGAALLNQGSAPKEQQMFLYDLDDNLLLAVFPYLETSEVLNVSQVCRYMLQKIYLLFGMEMSLIVPEWGVRPDRAALLEAQAQTQEEQRKKQGTPAIAAAVVTAQTQAPSAQITAQIAAQITAPAPAFAPASASAPTPEPVMLTKEIADSLTKKLNGKIRAGPGLLH